MMFLTLALRRTVGWASPRELGQVLGLALFIGPSKRQTECGYLSTKALPLQQEPVVVRNRN